MPSTDIIQGCAALQMNPFPVAGAKIFCFADGWSLAVGKAQSVSCFRGCGAVSACALGIEFAVWDLGLCPGHLQTPAHGPGKSQAWKGKRENVLPAWHVPGRWQQLIPCTRMFLLWFG